MTAQYWQHVTTGEVYAVEVNEHGKVVRANGPLAQRDWQTEGALEAILTNAYDNDLPDDLNAERDNYRSLIGGEDSQNDSQNSAR